MKYKIISYVREVKKYCIDNKKILRLVVVSLCVLCVLSWVKEYLYQQNFIKDESGKVIAIYRENIDVSEMISLDITARNGNEKLRQSVDLDFSDEEEAADVQDSSENIRNILEDGINNAKEKAQETETPLVILPRKDSQGTSFTWDSGRNIKWLFFLILIPITIILLYENSRNKQKKERQSLENSVKKHLPGFNSKILLLLQTGMVLSDTFLIACDGYTDSGREDFSTVIYRMKQQYITGNRALASVFREQSVRIKIREFSRLAKAIEDNQYKGVDLKERLDSESELLWEMRKNNAMEKGKLMETKLTFPLGALLIVLIIITAAPAVMQM